MASDAGLDSRDDFAMMQKLGLRDTLSKDRDSRAADVHPLLV